MVRRIRDFMNGEIRGLHEAAYLLGAFALFSQVLALVRDRLLASSFGASTTLDVYYASFRIPDIIFVSVASLVSVYVLIPFLTEKEAESAEAVRRFINTVFSIFLGLLLGVSLLAFIFAPFLLKLLFPGLTDTSLFVELIVLTRLLLLQPLFLGLSNLFGSITQTHRRFLLYALGPVLYNLGIIFGILALYPTFGVIGLGMGVVVGAIMHLCIQVPFVYTRGYLPQVTFSPQWKEVLRVVMISLPRTLAVSANQIALLILLGMASVLAVGSISIFNLAFNLGSVPLSIIGVSYSVAAFPTLAHLFTNGDRPKFLEHIVSAARHIIFWSFPITVLFIVLRAQIVRVILGAGNFGWSETRLVAAALALFAVSLIAQNLVLLFVRGYYAAGNTKTPLFINIATAVGIVSFSLLFLAWFQESPLFRYFMEALLRVENIAGTEVLMLPLGYSTALLLGAGALWVMFQRDFSQFWRTISQTVFHSMGAAIVMGFATYRFLDLFDNIFDINTFIGIFLQGLLSGLGGIIVGIILLVLLRNSEIREISRAAHHKFWKSRVVAPEQEAL